MCNNRFIINQRLCITDHPAATTVLPVITARLAATTVAGTTDSVAATHRYRPSIRPRLISGAFFVPAHRYSVWIPPIKVAVGTVSMPKKGNIKLNSLTSPWGKRSYLCHDGSAQLALSAP